MVARFSTKFGHLKLEFKSSHWWKYLAKTNELKLLTTEFTFWRKMHFCNFVGNYRAHLFSIAFWNNLFTNLSQIFLKMVHKRCIFPTIGKIFVGKIDSFCPSSLNWPLLKAGLGSKGLNPGESGILEWVSRCIKLT